MKKLLLQLDGDRYPSVFDRIVAHDAGADEVLSYGAVAPADVTGLVHGVLFTRAPKDLHHSAVWVGGSSVRRGEELLQAVVNSFFGPFRVSATMDANGCNTTAAATVARLAGVVPLKGARAVIMAGTGPVGLRAAVLLAREGASVILTSRALERALAASGDLRSRFGVEVEPREAADAAAVARALEGATICVTAGAAGATLLPRALWERHPTLRAMADVNAVPPLGIEGIEATDKATDRAGKVVFGALGIGSLKMKVHRACIARLFARNDEVLDVDTIYGMARTP